jgi:hypothetical protein
LTHSTLFGGNSTTESITLAAKFSNISSDIISQNNPDVDYDNSSLNDTSIIPKTKIILGDSTNISSDNSVSSLGLGIVIGIIIGIMIGIICIFIIRQKPPK